MSRQVRKIITIMGFMFFVAHIMACLYYFTARISDFDETSWVALIDLNS